MCVCWAGSLQGVGLEDGDDKSGRDVRYVYYSGLLLRMMMMMMEAKSCTSG